MASKEDGSILSKSSRPMIFFVTTAIGQKLRLSYLSTSPFYNRKTLPYKPLKGLRLNIHLGICGIVRHKHTEQAIGHRGDFQSCIVRVGVGLKGDDVVGICLHTGQPIHDKFIGFATGQALLVKCPFKKSGGILTTYAISLGKIPRGINNLVSVSAIEPVTALSVLP